MTIEAMGFISEILENAGINYEFGQWSSDPVPDPYFVGEYTEESTSTEDGQQNTTLMLTGTSLTAIALEQAKQTIKQLFPNVGGRTAILENGNGIAVFYDYSLNIPIDDPELKRIQINILVKEWSVN